MKALFLISFLAIANFASASNLYPQPIPSIDLSIKDGALEKVPYIKVGICPLFSDVGAGFRNYRFSDASKHARDHSLNFYCPHIPSLGGVLTYKYSLLKFNSSSSPKYMGIGLELGACAPGWKPSKLVPFPNIELIFGREYGHGDKCKWGQLGVNLLPISVGVLALFEGSGTGFGALGFLLVEMGAAMSAVTYTWGF